MPYFWVDLCVVEFSWEILTNPWEAGEGDGPVPLSEANNVGIQVVGFPSKG
jgi:hypothetical protein